MFSSSKKNNISQHVLASLVICKINAHNLDVYKHSFVWYRNDNRLSPGLSLERTLNEIIAVNEKAEDTVGKGENAGCHHVLDLWFSQCFQICLFSQGLQNLRLHDKGLKAVYALNEVDYA